MNIQTAYPVFEASQVLTSTQLNDLAEYLEEQDRLSRRSLTGIGVVCGFKVDADGTTVSISKGVAVTSEGFLICSDAQGYDRFRPYQVPVPTADEATEAEIRDARYPFLFPDDGPQIPVFELLDTDFAPAPGEAPPTPLTPAFLADKTVMLFLECRLESLKNCDINDCADKGAERRFTLRRLLVARAQADAMLAEEASIAERPVDLNTHPRNDLPFLRVEKLALARTEASTFVDLLVRIVAIALKLGGELPQALRDAYAAYGHLLNDLYPNGENPFPDSYFANVWSQLALNVLMVQYFYDYMRDVAMAYNEFVQTAARFEAECLPNPDRFPKHVLLGDAVDAEDGFTVTFPDPADVLTFDQSSATSGAGLTHRPVPRRSHFVPSPAAQHQPRLEEVRALFQRMHLLALNYRTQGLMTAPIRVTPSKTGDAPLSDRAIPFHYAFDQDSALFRNWSPSKVKTRLLNTVYSYQFSAPDGAHPLHFRLDDQDFIRIEGIVGKPLGSAMAELIAYKQKLGLSFSIEPVFMRLAASSSDSNGLALDESSAANAVEALRRLLLCRLSDLDVIFLVLIGAIFALLVLLIRLIGEFRPNFAVVDNAAAAVRPDATAFLDRATVARFRRTLSREEEVQLKIEADALRADLRINQFRTGDIVARLNPNPADDSAATIFAKVKDEAAGGNLFDRTRAFVIDQGGDEQAVQRVYAHTAMLNQTENLMGSLDVRSIADFDEARFSTAYRSFVQSFENYAAIAQASPLQGADQIQKQRQVLDASVAVIGQVDAFADGNLLTEFAAAVQGLFDNLTLEGFARRNPGLEHHAGVPVGGTLVLAYVSVADLARQVGPILAATVTPTDGLREAIAPGAVDVSEAPALAELMAAAEKRTEDALDDFIVLADFCLPYQCCEADCSDIALSESITADPFGDDLDPKPMAVPPVDGTPPPRVAPGRQLGAVLGNVGRNFTELIREFTARPVRIAETGLTGGAQRFLRPSTTLTPATEPAAPPDVATTATPPPAAREQPEEVTISGMVGVRRGDRLEPLADSAVIFILEDGREQRAQTEGGAFSITVPPGTLRLRGRATGHRGRTQTFELESGEARQIDLLMSPTR